MALTVTSSPLSDTPGPQPMQAPQPGLRTVAPARSKVSTRPLSRANFSTACEPNWMKNFTPWATRRPLSTASFATWW
jgi:hypothetical protein